MTGHGVRGTGTAPFFVTLSGVKSSICCRIAAPRVLRNGFVLILEQRLSAGTEPVCMPRPLRQRHHTLCRLPTVASSSQLGRGIYRRPRAAPSFIGRGRTDLGKLTASFGDEFWL